MVSENTDTPSMTFEQISCRGKELVQSLLDEKLSPIEIAAILGIATMSHTSYVSAKAAGWRSAGLHSIESGLQGMIDMLKNQTGEEESNDTD